MRFGPPCLEVSNFSKHGGLEARMGWVFELKGGHWDKNFGESKMERTGIFGVLLGIFIVLFPLFVKTVTDMVKGTVPKSKAEQGMKKVPPAASHPVIKKEVAPTKVTPGIPTEQRRKIEPTSLSSGFTSGIASSMWSSKTGAPGV